MREEVKQSEFGYDYLSTREKRENQTVFVCSRVKESSHCNTLA